MTAIAAELPLPVAIKTESNNNNNSTSTHSSTNFTETMSTTTSKSDLSSSHHNHPHILSHTLHDNLLQTHHEVDPLEFYTIEAVLGEGSMGFVAKVVKKDSVRGGSARPEFVKKHHHTERVCFCFPLSFFSFCPWNNDTIPNMKGTFIEVPPPNDSNHGNSKNFDVNVSSLTASDLSTTTTTQTSNPKVLHRQRSRSARIAYGTKKSTHFALKSIILDRCSTPEFKEELKNEVNILKSLDHPNIVRAFETFDYHGRLYIVMELCDGKDLYSRDPYTEQDAKRIMIQLLEAIAYLHGKGIVHRDLKYENIMFVNDSPNAEIRLIDFGLSQKFATGEHLHATVGTIYTMAPELIKGDYDAKADIWSLGVIAFMLLSSSMPFYGDSRAAVVDHILHGKYKFQSKRWQQISDDAKEFVMSLLRRRPEKRPSAHDALHNSLWLCDDYNASRNALTDTDRMDAIQASIQAFAGYKTLKKLALLVVAYKSTTEEIGFLRKMFSKFDTSEDGEITFEEFRAALLQNYEYTDEEIQSMFDGMDIDGTGKVHYMEFLAATIEANGSIDEERLAESFDRLDTDDSGVITVQNLKDFLGDELSDAYFTDILNEAHDDEDHANIPAITYDEFLSLWDLQADAELQSAKDAVSTHRRMKHALSSQLSAVSSTLSDDGVDDNIEDAETFHHEEKTTTAANVITKTGSCIFKDERLKAVEKVVTKYEDV